ncbi:MAG: DUF4377 domain-containing protein [Paludibacteraceae bacterium]|nr:DUF4377 domain-containing protein [Paludibacteraceae bacterium]
MKKIIIALIVLGIGLAACENGGVNSKTRALITEPTLTEMEINAWPMSPEPTLAPMYRGRWEDDGTTQLFSTNPQIQGMTIEGFEFEEGYECKLIVKESSYKNPPTDFRNQWYELVKVVSKTKVE